MPHGRSLQGGAVGIGKLFFVGASAVVAGRGRLDFSECGGQGAAVQHVDQVLDFLLRIREKID